MTRTYFVDFFNTTVYRKKSAKDVIFDFSEALGGKHRIEPAAIYNLFRKYQRKLTAEKFAETGEAEYTFGEVMARVADDLFRPYGGAGKEQFLADAPALYFQAELDQLVLNEKLVSFLRSQKSRGGVLISSRNSIAERKFCWAGSKRSARAACSRTCSSRAITERASAGARFTEAC